jgi:hypothetical protein
MATYDTVFSDLLGRPVVMGTDYILQSDDGTTIRLITLPDRLEPLSTEVVTQAVAGVSTTSIPTITATQMLIVLQAMGFLTKAEAKDRTIFPAAFSALLSGSEAENGALEIRWANLTIVERNDPLVSAFGSLLSLTSEQIDGMFIQASQV